MPSPMAHLFRWLHGSKMKQLAGIPGPVPTFPFGNALDFVGKQPWEVCADYGRTFGGVTLIWIFGSPALVLNDPELIGEVLDTRHAEFYKDSPCDALRPVITDDCPFICNGDDWAFKRANHPLDLVCGERGTPFTNLQSTDWLASQVVPLRQALAEGIERLNRTSANGPVDILESIQRLSFDVFSVAVWGQTLGDDAYRWFVTLGKMGNRRMNLELMFPLWQPLSPRFWVHRRRWYALFDTLIADAKANGDSRRADLLSVLLRRGTKLSATGFKDALANVFYGGVFSVTSAIVTTLYLLAQHPLEAERVRAAIIALGRDFAWAALNGCAGLDHVLREALRYYTPVPIYFRNTLQSRDVQLAGQALPPDTVLFITNWLLHRSPARWAEPARFDPSRWADGGVEKNPIGSGYFFPFGRGPRMCVGLPFAMFYMKLALATLLRDTAIELDPGQPYKQGFFFGVMMPQGLKARIVTRVA